MSAGYTTAELMAVFIARQLRDGEQVVVGTNLAIPRAGTLLAHWLHCPNLRLQVGGYMANFADRGEVDAFEFRGDFDMLGVGGIESYVPLDFENLGRVDLTFIGGLQVDRFGNTNMIGIADGKGGFKMRGPGTIGTASLTTFMKRYFIFLPSHSPRNLVNRCDFISTVGWGEGGADARQKLGLPGGGPELIITPLAVMDFEPASKAARLRHVAPGASVTQVQAATGFALLLSDAVTELPEPTAAELQVLRTQVDPHGVLRRP